MRDFATIFRHTALVVLTHSLLRAVPHDKVRLHKLQHHIETKFGGSAGCWPHNTQAQALWSLASFIGHRPVKGRGIGFSKQRVNLTREPMSSQGRSVSTPPLELLNLPHLGRYKSRVTESAILQALAITVKVMGVAGMEGKTDESTRCTLLQEKGLPKLSV